MIADFQLPIADWRLKQQRFSKSAIGNRQWEMKYATFS
jgi:hypothetical protein